MEAIIILSYAIRQDGTLTDIAKERADTALELLTKNKYDKIIASGGAGGFEKEKPVSEAESIKRYLTERGIDEKFIIKEEKSKDTIGNAVFAKKIAGEEKIKNFLVVTSDFHIERAKYVFDFVFGNGYNMEYAESKTKILTKEILGHEKESFELTEIFLNNKTKKENLENLLYQYHPFYAKNIENILELPDEKLSKELGINKRKAILYRKFIKKYLQNQKRDKKTIRKKVIQWL